MKVHRITFWKLLKPNLNLIVNVVLLFLLMGGLMLILYRRDGQIPNFLTALTIVYGLLITVPQLVLCINYYLNDRKKELLIDKRNEVVLVSIDFKEKAFAFRDIVNVVKIGTSHSRFKVLDTTATWRNFYYYKIVLNDGSSVNLTMFLIQKLEKIIPNIEYKYKKQFFPRVKDLDRDN